MSALPIPGQDPLSALFAAAHFLREATNGETIIVTSVEVRLEVGKDADIRYWCRVGEIFETVAWPYENAFGPVLADVVKEMTGRIGDAEKVRAAKVANLTAEAAKLGYVIEPAPKEAA